MPGRTALTEVLLVALTGGVRSAVAVAAIPTVAGAAAHRGGDVRRGVFDGADDFADDAAGAGNRAALLRAAAALLRRGFLRRSFGRSFLRCGFLCRSLFRSFLRRRFLRGGRGFLRRGFLRSLLARSALLRRGLLRRCGLRCRLLRRLLRPGLL